MNVDKSREIRLWITQIIFPVSATALAAILYLKKGNKKDER